MDFTDLGQAMSQSMQRHRIEKIETSSRVNYKTDLHHIPTERLEALADRYKRRTMVSPNDHGLKMRIQFILSEIGMRQMVADIERDVEADSQ